MLTKQLKNKFSARTPKSIVAEARFLRQIRRDSEQCTSTNIHGADMKENPGYMVSNMLTQ
jgi:hypothetical protein